VKSGARKNRACEILGMPIRTIQRWEKNLIEDQRKLNLFTIHNKLTDKETEEIISVCCSERFRDMNPHQIVPILAEEGKYIASERSFYRVLKENKLLEHRSECRLSQKKSKPAELKADGPNQVISWDITYLRSIIKGSYYYLYMFVDVWSRAIVGWDIYETESSKHASETMKRINIKNNVSGVRLHSDNGSPMKGATMLATLQNLGVIPSFSRPRVSDDNPYSEALFKTLKYKASYHKHFKTMDDAKNWVSLFVEWYNFEHRHSSIKYVTPMQRHTGEDKQILEKRKKTYIEARKKNPGRWSQGVRDWDRENIVYLNPNLKQDLTKKSA